MYIEYVLVHITHTYEQYSSFPGYVAYVFVWVQRFDIVLFCGGETLPKLFFAFHNVFIASL